MGHLRDHRDSHRPTDNVLRNDRRSATRFTCSCSVLEHHHAVAPADGARKCIEVICSLVGEPKELLIELDEPNRQFRW